MNSAGDTVLRLPFTLQKYVSCEAMRRKKNKANNNKINAIIELRPYQIDSQGKGKMKKNKHKRAVFRFAFKNKRKS